MGDGLLETLHSLGKLFFPRSCLVLVLEHRSPLCFVKALGFSMRFEAVLLFSLQLLNVLSLFVYSLLELPLVGYGVVQSGLENAGLSLVFVGDLVGLS